MRKYGWRIYALPVLAMLTVFIVIDTSTDAGTQRAEQESSQASVNQDQGHGEASEPPVAEVSPEPIDPDSPAAQLPGGGDYTEEGEGNWEVVDGSAGEVGEGDERYTYTVEVEDGIDSSSYGGDSAFASTVEAVLSDPRSWIGSGDVSFQRVDAADSEPDFRVSLTSPHTSRAADVCGYTIEHEASCYRRDIDRVVINLARWVRGAEAFESDIGMYRQYLINHEVGHVLGLGHVGCAEDGELAPVMMQQTFGVANDVLAELNADISGEEGTVPADGKTCRPNAWPSPQAGSDN